MPLPEVLEIDFRNKLANFGVKGRSGWRESPASLQDEEAENTDEDAPDDSASRRQSKPSGSPS